MHAPIPSSPLSSRGTLVSRVLIADDSAASRSDIAQTLGRLEGIESCEATNGAEAVSAVEKCRPDLVLCDHEMPVLNGLQTVQILRKKWSSLELPILMLTARQGTQEKVLAFRAGANDYVTKPAAPEELLARVSAQLSLKNAIQENLATQARLLHAAKLHGLGNLAAGLAHEINTPAQYIGDNLHFMSKAFAQSRQLLEQLRDWAGSETAGAEQARELLRVGWEERRLDFILNEVPQALGQSLNGIQKIAGVVSELKEFAGPERHVRAPADLNRAVENTIAVTRQEFPHDAEVAVELEHELPLVVCAVTEIKQAFLSILVNCAEASRGAFGGGRRASKILITTRSRKGGVEISFSDNGPGVDPSIREQVLEPFFTTKELGSGMGQGLSVAQRVIVERHRGRLDFETSKMGGACFKIWLPLA